MKIYSWNMLFRNRDLDRAFDFISKSDFDLFCLQEVPEGFLRRLQTLDANIAYRIDVEKLFKNQVVPMYNVILSKYKIDVQGEIPFPEYWRSLPLRTRIFVRLMPELLFSRIRNRGGLFVDISLPTSVVRVFCLHLVLARPSWRLKEFELSMMQRGISRPTIVCGDFNTIEAPHISILNWILGGDISDVFLHSRERTRMEKHFVEHELLNALSGSITHKLSRSQLDHILISNSFSIVNAEVISDRYGSDHNPIRVEVT